MHTLLIRNGFAQERDTAESHNKMLEEVVDTGELRVDAADGCAYSKTDFIQVVVTCVGGQVMMYATSLFVVPIGGIYFGRHTAG